MGLLYVVGIGPGAIAGLTGDARAALERADAWFGYDTYLQLLDGFCPEKPRHASGMRREVERCREALALAAAGRTVALVCSGDPGVYGMAGLALELAEDVAGVTVEVIPGVTAALSGAALLGAPFMHDFAVISLSDLLTPWETIAKRLAGAAAADFVICLYNPGSGARRSHLARACDIVLRERAADTVCGWARNVGRPGAGCGITTLAELRDYEADMFTTVFIGSSATRLVNGNMVTPRGYREFGS